MTPSVLLVFHSTGDKKVSISRLPPIGILTIASFLEHHGILCDVIDFSINPSAQIQPENYDLIGFSINISNRESSLKTIADIKKELPHKKIVVGGSLCISNPEYFFDNPDIDVIFTGEGEEALFEYVTFDDKENVKGLYLKNGSEFSFTGPRNWIEDLDSLPFPALHKVDITKYNCIPKKKRPITSIMTSRGCPFSCIFCSLSMGKKWRPRSARNVVDEIKWQVNQLGVKEICVFDDNFSLNRSRAKEICDLLIAEKIPVTLQFTNGLRVDCLDHNLLLKLKKAGTWLIGLAPETGNQEVMKKIKKGFKHPQVLKIREKCQEFGIKTFGFFMIGFPFETLSDIEDTIRFAKELNCDIVEFNKVVPYAKTELYEMLLKTGTLLANPFTHVRSYHDGTIKTHKVGDLSAEEVKTIIRSAYRQYYLRPKVMLNLIKTFSPRDLWDLTTYALKTRNI